MYYGYRAPGHRRMREEYARVLTQAGFSWMEVDAPHVPDPDFEREVLDLKDRFGLQVSVHCHFVDVNLSSHHPQIRAAAVDVVKGDLDFAGRVGASVAVVHPGDIGWFDFLPADHPGYAESREMIDFLFQIHGDAVVESLKDCAAHAESRGVKLTAENMYCPWDVLVAPAEWEQLFRKHDIPNLGMILDFGHARVAGRDPLEYVKAAGTRIWHTHIHANDTRYDVHQPLVGGDPILEKALRELVRANPNVTLLLELPPRRMEDFLEGLEILRGFLGLRPA